MREASILLAVVMFCLGTGRVALAQEVLQKPILEPGAVFQFQSVDLLKNSATSYSHTVLSVEGDKARLDEVTDKTPKGKIVTLDIAHQCVLSQSVTGVFECMRFPLKVGDTWKYSFAAPQDGVTVTRDLTAKFVGWERIEVPAGKFNAAKIEHTGNWQRSDGPYSGGLEFIFWYVPEVGRIVKQSVVWYGYRGGINTKYEILLTKYQPAPDMTNPSNSLEKPAKEN